MQGAKVSMFQRFVVITLSLVILGVLLTAGLVVLALGLLFVPLFLLLKGDKPNFIKRREEKKKNSIDAEFERVE